MKGAHAMLEKLKNISWEYVVTGSMLAIIGLCFLFFSGSLLALSITVSVIIALFGLALGTLSILGSKRDFYFAIRIALASLCFAGGIVSAIFNKSSVEVLICVVCFVLIVDASFKLVTSIASQRLSVYGWWILMAVSSIVIISAFLLTKLTPENMGSASIWLGITSIVDAASSFAAPLWESKCKVARKARLYYEVYRDIENIDKR